jgi:hypothetical protein
MRNKFKIGTSGLIAFLSLVLLSSCDFVGGYELTRLDSLEVQLKAKKQSQQDSLSRLLEITGGRELETIEEQIVVPEGAVAGDFNGDNRKDFVYLEQPSPMNVEKGICTTVLKASTHSSMTDYVFNSCYSKVSNVGDVDDDGTEELQLIVSGANGSWSSVYLLAYVESKWKPCIEPFMIHLGDSELTQYIEKVGQGRVKIYYNDVSEDGDKELLLNKTVRVVK